MASGAALAYGQLLRPRLARWGATEQEVGGPYPGTELVPGGERAATMAVTIDAPREEVWPWLVQLGGDRAGWYSWDLLDNAGVPSAREVHPEWQERAIGDLLKFRVPGTAMMDAYMVAMLEPNRFLGLYGLTDLRARALDADRPRPRAYMEGLWGFQLLRAGRRPHPSRRRRTPGHATAMARTVLQLLGLRPGGLDHAVPHAGRAEEQHRTRRSIPRVAGDRGR